MTHTSRNIRFTDAAQVIWEGDHAILYRTGRDNFGKDMYNIGISAWSTWTPTPILYWKDYSTRHGAYGGLHLLVTMAKEVNRQASLVIAHKDNIEDVIRVARAEKINSYVIYDIMGYYVGPNKHTGTVPPE